MPILHQFDYLFAIGTIFAFLDAWNIGANDVANSFATSVSSRSLTMKQAMCIASVMEFVGSVAVGARVAETIRTKIIDPKLFDANPALLMLGMVCTVIASSTYLTLATKLGLPVSTTHSIMGGVIGMGVASVGASRVSWGWKGVAQVFAAWGIAPGLAGVFGAIIFLLTKYGVMRRSNPVRNAFFSIPIYFFITGSLIAMLIVWKGASSKIELSDGGVAGVIVGVGAGIALLVIVFLLPYLYRKVIKGDWQLRPWHIPLGPLLLRRGEIPAAPEGMVDSGIQNYYRGHLTREELDAKRTEDAAAAGDVEKGTAITTTDSASDVPHAQQHSFTDLEESVSTRPEGPISNPKVAFWYAKRWFFRGVEKDVVSMQKKRDILSGDIEEAHARSEHYDNRAEYLYSFLQILTATAASFTHGANDVSNAIGPYATIYLIWSTGQQKSSVPVPTWILAFGGAGIVIGLWTYGYNIMRNLGNRLTLMSPSRGFSMELGSAVTIIMATRLKLPVSTTQCITGATVGVGLCNGDWRTINWRMVAWIYGGWFITLPVTAIISGCLMGIIINAPRWGYASQ
ncbi:phosphate transporter [Eremomyces bilateralis CBS 781.70]|uniref:Phosphate transporter n=1 Tax=Eremomyces bilateralis CBS 781.70 TaxID=1392243 RepID=A0A6G1FVN1_9PEZI|nr:phosphate transporter [Eremomyces bilateralis CBS 781.70]KAF1809699.1 phosphate transporter [Eremomyces bilateralis CBS 781.70]